MSQTKSNQMWGGRFESAPDDVMMQINASIDVDKRLYRQDIQGSLAHAKMLAACGIIKAEEAQKISEGLQQIRGEIENGSFVFKTELEDIHMNIEARLKEIIGDVAGKLHTARSRNDQVATDFRLWMKEAVMALIGDVDAFLAVLNDKANEHKNTIMPGFTHLQIAQPVTLGLHLEAWAAMLARDRGRLADALERLDECPLGAGALAGTSFPIDRAMTAEELGFKQPVANTMDAVAARDFVLEFLSVASICAVHLSRFAEELILWSTSQFGYIRLSDSFTTGSSIMPQKKNPDAAELVRGKSGKMIGALMQMLTVMKGLPLTYNKDMQDDKEAVFAAFDTLQLCLKAMGGMVAGMQVHVTQMRADTENGFSTATDLADWLVKELAMPFRDAHHVTGQIVKMAENKSCKLDELALADMQSIEPRITDTVFEALNVEKAVEARLKK
ncbi:MAG: argininosuccinate lyase [Rhodospirillales bacterium]|nr:argininosuccinate lyase [Rhodospirillales bacterium]